MPKVNVRTFLIDCDGLEIERSDEEEEEEEELPSSGAVSTFPAGSFNSGARSFSLLAGIFLSLFISYFQRERERESERMMLIDVVNDKVGRERSRVSLSRDTARVSLNFV